MTAGLRLAPVFDPLLLARVEDAGLNASAPPQQRWQDGWLVRFSPGKAKRARCVNALAADGLPLERKLALAQAVFDEAQLPLILRITPFSRPSDLDRQLELRGSPLAQRQAHAQRLELSPVPFRALAIRREDDGAVLACGQFAREADLVGLYDVFTQASARGQGLARRLCAGLLARARDEGARSAYLQVEGDNHAARSVYRRLGFFDGYAYHYRGPAGAG